MASKKALLRFRDVAHILDCTPDDVLELARKKKLEGTKTSRYWRYRLEDVLAYKKRRKKEEI
jgi:hypothetical protein